MFVDAAEVKIKFIQAGDFRVLEPLGVSNFVSFLSLHSSIFILHSWSSKFLGLIPL